MSLVVCFVLTFFTVHVHAECISEMVIWLYALSSVKECIFQRFCIVIYAVLRSHKNNITNANKSFFIFDFITLGSVFDIFIK